MIRSFKDDDTGLFWDTGKSRRIPADIRRTALKKLTILNWATSLSEMAIPAGNRLEALRGERQGQYSVRVNNQFRLCFSWREGDAFEVEIVDYH